MNTSDSALYFIEDILQRSSISFILLGDTAKTIVDSVDGFDSTVTGDITIGILKKDLTESGQSFLKMLIPGIEISDNMELEHEGTKIKIKVINRNYKVFKAPDFKFYKVTEFNIPNPFRGYWKMRHLVR